MKFLLDTNICIYIIKRKPENVIKKFGNYKPGLIALSNITVAELYYGAYKSSRPDENIVALQEFMLPLLVLDFDKKDAIVYGKIRTELEMMGLPIGAMDLLIGSQAVSRGLILITNNEKEFSRIKDLHIENWKKS